MSFNVRYLELLQFSMNGNLQKVGNFDLFLELRNVNSTLTTEDAQARLKELTGKVNTHQLVKLMSSPGVCWWSVSCIFQVICKITAFFFCTFTQRPEQYLKTSLTLLPQWAYRPNSKIWALYWRRRLEWVLSREFLGLMCEKFCLEALAVIFYF